VTRLPRRRFLALAIAALVAAGAGAHIPTGPAEGFAARVARLSEPPGYFDTDNLVSNERSYLHVVPALRAAGFRGGAYLGVGPDQNFSYIAQTRPSIAFIIDVRRDNLLLHLLFKALFQLSASRAEYLSLLFGRPPPGPDGKWVGADIEQIVSYIDAAAPAPQGTAALGERLQAVIKGFAVASSADDLATIDRFHRRFIERGLSLKFESAGRQPRPYYPTYRELLLETDTSGRRWSYLASEVDFQFVRSLQARDLVVPVVGDLAGPTAMGAIGRLMKERGDRLSAFYTSNVEYYLANGRFQRFVANLAGLPHTRESVIIRAVFPNRFGRAPAPPGYYSTSVVQRVDDLLDGAASGRIRNYGDLVRDR
jgi:hypothetical protein